MARKMYAGNAPATTLNGGVTNVATAIAVTSGTGYPSGASGNFWIVIDRGLSAEEKILCNNTTGNTITAVDRTVAGNRDGTTNASHVSGAVVEHVFTAQDADEANDHINTTTNDHHTQYIKTDGTRAFTGVTAIANSAPTTSAVGDAAAIGAGNVLARSTHVHGRESAATLAAAIIPAGTIWATGAAAAATGWLMCDGAEVLGVTYPALATEFSTGGSSRFGAAAAGNIKLPDLRQKFPMGKAASGTGSTLGGTGGSKDAVAVSHNHTQDAHLHVQNSHNHTQDVHGHGFSDPGHIHAAAANQYVITNIGAGFAVQGSGTQNVTFTTNTASGTTGASVVNATSTNQAATATDTNTTATNQAGGVSGTDANLPAYQVINYMVKAH